jgi:hypothetical protein
MDQDGHLLQMHLPPPATHTSNERNAANSVGLGWFWTTCLCGWAAAGEVDVFINNIFCTQKYRLQTKFSPFAPENAAAASSNYSKAGPGERMVVHAAKALNSEEAAQKSWFRAGVENGLERGRP